MKAETIIKLYYRLNRKVTKLEVEAEIKSLKRHYKNGTLDDFYSPLYYKLEQAGYIENAKDFGKLSHL